MANIDGRPVELAAFLGPIGLSHRNRDDDERRFQNPGKDRPIALPEGLRPLLFGIWTEDLGDELPEPVISVADVHRRVGRSTRFSVFTPLDTLREALSCGWAETRSETGERLICFRLEHLQEFLEVHCGVEGEQSSGLVSAIDRELISAGLTADEALAKLRRYRSLEDAASHLGLAAGVLHAIYEQSGRPFLLMRGIPRTSAAELVQSLSYLQRAADELGVESLSASRYDAFARNQQLTIEEWPRSSKLKRLHGGWSEACDAAGIDPPESASAARIPSQQCRIFLDRYVGSCLAEWEQPTRSHYLLWRSENGGPSIAQIERQLGPFDEQLVQALHRADAASA